MFVILLRVVSIFHPVDNVNTKSEDHMTRMIQNNNMARRRCCGLSRSRSTYLPFRLLDLFALLNCAFALFDDPIHDICAIQHYDFYNLTTGIWVLRLEESNCLPLQPPNASLSQGCELRIGICKVLSISGPCGNSSVCQKSADGLLSLGTFSENPFNSQDPLPDGVDGFHTNFFEGASYKTKSKTHCQLQTSIAFQCDHSANWSTQGSVGLRDTPNPIDVHYNDSNCQMDITFGFSGACEIKSDHKTYLSVGTVLIIIFFITVLLYLIIGILVNAIRGQSGLQLIPNTRFWALLVGYIKEGCLFVFCCRQRPDSDTYSAI